MIKELQLRNFKCFRQSPIFEFSQLTLLTGINGRGKSSLLQSILLIAQSADPFRPLKDVKLSHYYVDLGNFDDIKNSDTPRGENILYKIKLLHPNLDVTLSLCEDQNDPLSAKVEAINIDVDKNLELELLSTKVDEWKKSFGPDTTDIKFDLSQTIFQQKISRIHYISADRLGPVKYVEKESLSDFINVGPRGDFTINILAIDNLPLVHEDLYRGSDAKTVIQQTEEWLDYILDGASIEIRGKEKASSVLYMLLNNKSNTYRYKPSNVGFGYSYILPLIVSGLIAKNGDILMIENPEAHLHPKAQSKIMEFFARVASTGVQVIIESHSEHILNGLRVCALDPSIKINHEDVTIQYFNESFDAIKLAMDNKGKIENWPDGFFDQQEKDLANIFKRTR